MRYAEDEPFSINASSKQRMDSSNGALLEMLEASIPRYQNKIQTAAEVMDELIKLSKEIFASDDEAKQMGLTEFEYAFHTAVANKESARELIQ